MRSWPFLSSYYNNESWHCWAPRYVLVHAPSSCSFLHPFGKTDVLCPIWQQQAGLKSTLHISTTEHNSCRYLCWLGNEDEQLMRKLRLKKQMCFPQNHKPSTRSQSKWNLWLNHGKVGESWESRGREHGLRPVECLMEVNGRNRGSSKDPLSPMRQLCCWLFLNSEKAVKLIKQRPLDLGRSYVKKGRIRKLGHEWRERKDSEKIKSKKSRVGEER